MNMSREVVEDPGTEGLQDVTYAVATVNGRELQRLGLSAGARVRVSSRRGAVDLHLRRDDGTPDGTVFMPFAFREAAANLLTNAALDPAAKIAEVKYCAVRVHSLE